MSASTLLAVYAVRNFEGKWFRAKGLAGSGLSWVNDLKKAKIYGNIGQAKARVTFFAKAYPNLRKPEVVELRVTMMRVIETKPR